jgi:hypothetical protein
VQKFPETLSPQSGEEGSERPELTSQVIRVKEGQNNKLKQKEK